MADLFKQFHGGQQRQPGGSYQPTAREQQQARQQFNQFRAQNQGVNPGARINQMIASGQITQAQADAAVQMARRLSGFFF